MDETQFWYLSSIAPPPLSLSLVFLCHFDNIIYCLLHSDTYAAERVAFPRELP